MIKNLARFVLVFLLAALLAKAEDVSVFLEPSVDGTVYFKEDLETLNKRSPKPYPEGQEVTEWMQLQYPGTYVGHVEPSFVSDDMAVAQGASIHLRPQKSSPIMATVTDSFKPQVIEIGPNWATVFYEGNATAYFRWPSKQATPAEAPEIITVSSVPAEGGEILAVSEATEIKAPASSADTIEPVAAGASTPAADKANTVTPAPTPTNSASAEVATPPVLEPIAASPRTTLPVSPPPPPLTSDQVTRVWEGTLVRNRGLEKLFGKDYPYYLENEAGKRIAYVDFSQALLFQPIENFWDAKVIINGTAEKIIDTTPVLIKVRVIRPAF